MSPCYLDAFDIGVTNRREHEQFWTRYERFESVEWNAVIKRVCDALSCTRATARCIAIAMRPSYMMACCPPTLFHRFSLIVECLRFSYLKCAHCWKSRFFSAEQRSDRRRHLWHCAACECEYYCCVACQRADWPAHKARCKLVRSFPPELRATLRRAAGLIRNKVRRVPAPIAEPQFPCVFESVLYQGDADCVFLYADPDKQKSQDDFHSKFYGQLHRCINAAHTLAHLDARKRAAVKMVAQMPIAMLNEHL